MPLRRGGAEGVIPWSSPPVPAIELSWKDCDQSLAHRSFLECGDHPRRGEQAIPNEREGI
jgi:hypothetical protein